MSKQKRACEKCKGLFRFGKLRRNRANNQWWCKKCLKEYGENKFYIPPEKRWWFNKNGLTMEEKQVLFKQYILQGMDADKARYKVNNRNRFLFWINRKMNYLQNRKEEREKQKAMEIKQNFLEGLKSG